MQIGGVKIDFVAAFFKCLFDVFAQAVELFSEGHFVAGKFNEESPGRNSQNVSDWTKVVLL